MSAFLSARAPTRRALCALPSSGSGSSSSSLSPLSSSILHPRPFPLQSHSPPTAFAFMQARTSAHASQGRANRAARGPGKRLGLKKGATEPVVPGNIIFRQRGTGWFAGENCVMGRDHTINALQPGFVRYYRDPARHPTRKYIGVVLRQEDTLPRPEGAARRRRLGMVARPITSSDPSASTTPVLSAEGIAVNARILSRGPAGAAARTPGPSIGTTNALGIPPPSRRFAGRTKTNAQIGALGDYVTAKLKEKARNRGRNKLRLLRRRLNVRKRLVRRHKAGEATRDELHQDEAARAKRRGKSRHRAKR